MQPVANAARFLNLHGAPNAAFILDDVAGTDVHAADLHGSRLWKRAGAAAHGRTAGARHLASGGLAGKKRIRVDGVTLPPAVAAMHPGEPEMQVVIACPRDVVDTPVSCKSDTQFVTRFLNCTCAMTGRSFPTRWT